jgi:hypothetical protein
MSLFYKDYQLISYPNALVCQFMSSAVHGVDECTHGSGDQQSSHQNTVKPQALEAAQGITTRIPGSMWKCVCLARSGACKLPQSWRGYDLFQQPGECFQSLIATA